MRYLRIYAQADGASRFEDCELKGTLTQFASGIPPLLVSGPFGCTAMMVIESVADLVDDFDYAAHVAPRKQWVIVTSGRFAVTTTDGSRRELSPGSIVLAEDTTGQGHLTTPVTRDVICVVIPVSD